MNALNLKQTPPSLPRAQWTQHPHYATQTLLLGSHRNFLEVSAYLIAAARRDEARVVGPLYQRWVSAMRSHEHYEEHKLYPYLAHRWGADFDEAAAGHHQLHVRDQHVRDTLAAPWNADRVAEALTEHDAVLRAHLMLEEELVIPLLLALTPSEFERYARSPIELLLA